LTSLQTGMKLPTVAAWRLLVVLAAAFLGASFSLAPARERESAPQQIPGTFDPLLYNYPPALQATLGAFGKAVEDYAAGRFEAALAALPKDSAAATTAVPDQILLYRAKIDLELGNGRDALDVFRSLPNLHPDSTVLKQALLGEARALVKLNDPAAALEVLDRAKLKDSAEILSLRGQALEQETKKNEAIQVYLHIYAEYANSSQSVFAEQRLRVLAPTFQMKPENRGIILRRGENLVRAGKNLEARTLLLKLNTAHPGGAQGEKLRVVLADADTNLKRLAEALRYLRSITDPALDAQALYLEGACNRGLKNQAAFLATRDRALQNFPQSPYTEKLLYSVATYYDVENEPMLALQAYQAIARGFPKGEYFERALWKVALYSYVAKRYQDALTGFWQCLLADKSPGSAAASAYWMGRCCLHLGDPEKAVYFYRRSKELSNSSYYGQRAQEALASLQSEAAGPAAELGAVDFQEISRTLDGIHAGQATISSPSTAAVWLIERSRQLLAAGIPDLALAELERAPAGSDADDRAVSYSMSRIYQSKGNYPAAIAALRRAIPDYAELPPASLPDEVWEILFPVRHFNIVTTNAARNNVDPNLVLALIRQESAFQETARSSANARGLMQVLPSTGRILAGKAGIVPYSVSKLYHPDANIALGTRYLASLLQRYDGKVELALAAYNAGDSRVDRWLEEFGNLDMAEFVERIPFGETRGYVKQVLSSLAHYHLRTAVNPGSSADLQK